MNNDQEIWDRGKDVLSITLCFLFPLFWGHMFASTILPISPSEMFSSLLPVLIVLIVLKYIIMFSLPPSFGFPTHKNKYSTEHTVIAILLFIQYITLSYIIFLDTKLGLSLTACTGIISARLLKIWRSKE